jgi:sec-independent protein translocase protein TatA
MPQLGLPELIVILVIIVIIFGVGRLGEIGGALGRGIREFRRASSSLGEPEEENETTPALEEKKEA